MNTLKITDINRPLTERHDLERAKITEAEILGKRRKIYNPCNLNLVIDRKCNCDCCFCFFGGEAGRKRITDDEYMTKLNNVLQDWGACGGDHDNRRGTHFMPREADPCDGDDKKVWVSQQNLFDKRNRPVKKDRRETAASVYEGKQLCL